MAKRKRNQPIEFPVDHDPTATTTQRDRIILLARERFLKDGFSNVTMDELASDLMISKKTFYKNFHSKDELLADVVARVIGEMAMGVGAIIAGDQQFLAKLSSLMEFIAKRVGVLGRPFLWDLQRNAPEQWKRVQEFRRTRVVPNFLSLVDQGVREGYIRKDINPRVLMLAFLGTIEAILVPSVLANEPFSTDEAVRGILKLFFHGLLTNEASDELELLDRKSIPQHA
jgi:AcrR family transcriptional regulator